MLSPKNAPKKCKQSGVETNILSANFLFKILIQNELSSQKIILKNSSGNKIRFLKKLTSFLVMINSTIINVVFNTDNHLSPTKNQCTLERIVLKPNIALMAAAG